MQTSERAFPQTGSAASRAAIGWRSMSHDSIFVVVVPSGIEGGPTKKPAISEEPAPCQDTCDPALAFSLVGTMLRATYSVAPGSDRLSPGPYRERFAQQLLAPNACSDASILLPFDCLPPSWPKPQPFQLPAHLCIVRRTALPIKYISDIASK